VGAGAGVGAGVGTGVGTGTDGGVTIGGPPAATGAGGPPKSSQSGSLDMISWLARPRPVGSVMTISDPLPVANGFGVGCPAVSTEPAVVKFMSGAMPMPVVNPLPFEK
jgi:hypothetical protein